MKEMFPKWSRANVGDAFFFLLIISHMCPGVIETRSNGYSMCQGVSKCPQYLLEWLHHDVFATMNIRWKDNCRLSFPGDTCLPDDTTHQDRLRPSVIPSTLGRGSKSKLKDDQSHHSSSDLCTSLGLRCLLRQITQINVVLSPRFHSGR